MGSDQADTLSRLQSALIARLNSYIYEEQAVGIVVKKLQPHADQGFAESFARFVQKHKVPVMVPNANANQQLHGMTVEELVAGIVEFWTRLKVLPAQAERQHHTRTANPTPESPPAP